MYISEGRGHVSQPVETFSARLLLIQIPVACVRT